MAKNQTVEKFNDEIPQKILNIIRAEDTALEIARICFENEIKEDVKIRGISYQTGRVLVGDLPFKDFGKTIEKKIALSPFVASKIAREINDSIFSQVKESLSLIYGEDAFPAESLDSLSKIEEKEIKRSKDTDAYLEEVPEDSGLKKGLKSDTLKGPDSYREPIE